MTLPPHAQAGVCLHLSSLPGTGGIGTLGQVARNFVDTLVAMNQSVWQFLPTGPTAYGDSPYQPLSSFAGNEMLIDMDELVQRGLLAAGEIEALHALPVSRVDYGALIPLKRKLLALAANRFAQRAGTALQADYEGFVQTHNALWLHDYAMYRLLKTRHQEQAWPTWQPEFVHRETDALRRIEQRDAALLEAVKVQQFLFHHQWHTLRAYAHAHGVQLFGDMPIYIALDSADAWANRALLQVNADGEPRCLAGVPPDYFSADGQLWGNPLYDWDYQARTGYRWWIERLRHAENLKDLIRIDHFRGFQAYWSVPAGAATARDGHWETGPGDAVFDAIRAAIGELPLVAEDLGLITPEVDALRHRQQLPGMRVLQFDVAGEHFDLDSISANTVCYTGTHDNDTTAGWFHGSTDDPRPAVEILALQQHALAHTGGQAQTIHHDLIRLAYASQARLAVVPLQDFLGLGSEARLNTPGQTGGNWQWRVQAEQLDEALMQGASAMTGAAGRGRR